MWSISSESIFLVVGTVILFSFYEWLKCYLGRINSEIDMEIQKIEKSIKKAAPSTHKASPPLLLASEAPANNTKVFPEGKETRDIIIDNDFAKILEDEKKVKTEKLLQFSLIFHMLEEKFNLEKDLSSFNFESLTHYFPQHLSVGYIYDFLHEKVNDKTKRILDFALKDKSLVISFQMLKDLLNKNKPAIELLIRALKEQIDRKDFKIQLAASIAVIMFSENVEIVDGENKNKKHVHFQFFHKNFCTKIDL